MAARLTGWRYGLFVGTIVGAIGLHSYFTMIRPMIDPEPYKRMKELANSQGPRQPKM